MGEGFEQLVSEKTEKLFVTCQSEAELLDRVVQELSSCINLVDGSMALLSTESLKPNRDKVLKKIHESSIRLFQMAHFPESSYNEPANLAEFFSGFQHIFHLLNPISSTTGGFPLRLNWQAFGWPNSEGIQIQNRWSIQLMKWLSVNLEIFKPDYALLFLMPSKPGNSKNIKLVIRTYFFFKHSSTFGGGLHDDAHLTELNTAHHSKSLALSLAHYLLVQMKAKPSVFRVHSKLIQLNLECIDKYFKYESPLVVNQKWPMQSKSLSGFNRDCICLVAFNGLPTEYEEFLRVSLPPMAEAVDFSPTRLHTTKNLPLVIFETSKNSSINGNNFPDAAYRKIFRISCASYDVLLSPDDQTDAWLVWPFDAAAVERALIQVLV